MPRPDGFEQVGDVANRLVADKLLAMLRSGEAEQVDDDEDPRGARYVFTRPEPAPERAEEVSSDG